MKTIRQLKDERSEWIVLLRKAQSYQEEHRIKMIIDDIEEQMVNSAK